MSYSGNRKMLLVAIYCTISVFVIVTVLSMTIPPTKIVPSRYMPSIAVNEQNMYMVWIDNSTGHFQLSFKKSTDNGRTFEKQITLAKNIIPQPFNPEIKVSGKNLYVIYHVNETGILSTFLTTSKDEGNTFNGIINIT